MVPAVVMLVIPGALADWNAALWFLLLCAVGILAALSTLVLGIVASIQRRQFGWLGGLLVPLFVAIGGWWVLFYLIYPQCAGYYGCTNGSAQLQQATDVITLLAFAPVLAGLIGLVYSFRIHAPKATAPGARVQKDSDDAIL
jgi:hypothetical protein